MSGNLFLDKERERERERDREREREGGWGRESEKEGENAMLVSTGIKFIRREQKQHRNGEACRARPTCFWSSLINLILKDTNMIFC